MSERYGRVIEGDRVGIGTRVEGRETKLEVSLLSKDGPSFGIVMTAGEARDFAAGLVECAGIADRENVGGGYHCRLCGMTSHSHYDLEHRYCGACHRFEDSIDG